MREQELTERQIRLARRSRELQARERRDAKAWPRWSDSSGGAHTPGPWTFQDRGASRAGRGEDGRPYAWVNLDAPGHLGGMVIHGHASQSDEEMQANGRLIAHAPAMLADLRKMLADIGAFQARTEHLPAIVANEQAYDLLEEVARLASISAKEAEGG